MPWGDGRRAQQGLARAIPGHVYKTGPGGKALGAERCLGRIGRPWFPWGGLVLPPSSSSIIVAAWLPLLDMGPSSDLAATVGWGFSALWLGHLRLWISLGF